MSDIRDDTEVRKEQREFRRESQRKRSENHDRNEALHRENDPVLLAILDIFTTAQIELLVEKVRQVEQFGHGRITIVINDGKMRLIQAEESYDFRGENRLT